MQLLVVWGVVTLLASLDIISVDSTPVPKGGKRDVIVAYGSDKSPCNNHVAGYGWCTHTCGSYTVVGIICNSTSCKKREDVKCSCNHFVEEKICIIKHGCHTDSFVPVWTVDGTYGSYCYCGGDAGCPTYDEVDTEETEYVVYEVATDVEVTEVEVTDGQDTEVVVTDGQDTEVVVTDGDDTEVVVTDGDDTEVVVTDGDDTEVVVTDGDDTEVVVTDGDDTEVVVTDEDKEEEVMKEKVTEEEDAGGKNKDGSKSNKTPS